MKEYLNKILNKNYIKFNIFSYVISILIVKKLNKKLKIYINYKIFNALIIFNRNISSLIKETLFKLYTIKIYNKFNIIATFNEIRIKKSYKKKIVFLIKYKLYEYFIILFDFYNAPTTFQTFINNILKKYLNILYTIYLNNIFIYNDNKKNYILYVEKILKKLKKINLFLNINKYDFHVIRIKYLKLIIIIEGIKINYYKINIIR